MALSPHTFTSVAPTASEYNRSFWQSCTVLTPDFSKDEAAESCADGYHLCSKLTLPASHIAKILISFLIRQARTLQRWIPRCAEAFSRHSTCFRRIRDPSEGRRPVLHRCISYNYSLLSFPTLMFFHAASRLCRHERFVVLWMYAGSSSRHIANHCQVSLHLNFSFVAVGLFCPAWLQVT